MRKNNILKNIYRNINNSKTTLFLNHNPFFCRPYGVSLINAGYIIFEDTVFATQKFENPNMMFKPYNSPIFIGSTNTSLTITKTEFILIVVPITAIVGCGVANTTKKNK